MVSRGKQTLDSSVERFHRYSQPVDLIRLICVDIDGTLLDSRFELRNSVREALRRASQDGINIALATGRNLDSTIPIAAALGMKLSIISSVGGHIRAADGQTVEVPLVPKQARDILRIGLCSGSGLFVDHPDRSWTLGVERFLSMYAHVNHGTPATSVERSLFPPPLKISLINEKNTLERVKAIISKRYPKLQLAASFENVVDVTAKQATKGYALYTLAEMMGIPLRQTAAMGDSENDLSNFMVSGLSIAMENAPEKIRAAADWIAPSNDHEGVVWAVSQIRKRNKEIAPTSEVGREAVNRRPPHSPTEVA